MTHAPIEDAGGSWSDWGNHVLIELKRVGDSINQLRGTIQEQQIEVYREIAATKAECLATKAELKAEHAKEIAEVRLDVRELKTKATVFGAIAGFIGSGLLTVLKVMFGH